MYCFLSHKINFVSLCFHHFSQKKIFFLETKKFSVFYVFWTQAIILRKVVRRPADKTLTKKNFDFKLFLNHLTDPLHTWYDGKTT